ncbi:uncharacterized protein LOC126369269 [Pectinophora gossypiella]|uniref:uncharacterized protein LOC126369269 n=1 Tax=Pectinophora gossypiella TaxID=13191 RepID=UPI00214EF493|nr:uncharacterized protein LOC126369269 [Pectinophora gossypiella]
MVQTKLTEASNAAATMPTNTDNSAVVMSSTSQARGVVLPTAVVRLIDKNGKFIHARALLDTGSQVSFVSEKLASKIDCNISPTNQIITGVIQGTNIMHKKADISVYSSINDFKLNVSCLVTKNITCELPQQSFDIKGFNIPSHARLADKSFNKTGEILLLLGADVFFQVLQRESLPLTPTGPFLVNTSFGYVVAGSLPVSAGQVSSSNFCVTVQDLRPNLPVNSWDLYRLIVLTLLVHSKL